MFLDEATITISGGKGGDGCVSWRREKYIPKGGPDGGDGGKGGCVVFIANENTDTLSGFWSKKNYLAGNGCPGEGKRKTGKSADDLYIKVPVGTLVYKKEGDIWFLLTDLSKNNEQYTAARGGRGGYGNAHFKSSVRQRPDFSEKGEKGEKMEIKLELKLVAEAGIIGLPSVGKSTLISVISDARPKIAAYPFTTLVPNLGVVTILKRSYTVCDVPGLIAGASEGKGLGDAFLKHIERCGILVHLLDADRSFKDGRHDFNVLAEDYRTIRRELAKYSSNLANKKEIVVLNKIDLINNETEEECKKYLSKKKITVDFSISAQKRMRTDGLTKFLLPLILNFRKEQSKLKNFKNNNENKILRPHLEAGKMDAFEILKQADGSLLIKGRRLEQLTNMTNFQNQGGLKRFKDVAKRIGLIRTINRERKKGNPAVFIGDIKVDEYF